MMNHKWWEKYIGGYTFYFGFYTKREFKLGMTIGNRELTFDLLFCSIGVMRFS